MFASSTPALVALSRSDASRLQSCTETRDGTQNRQQAPEVVERKVLGFSINSR
jgi:hypothetical protein